MGEELWLGSMGGIFGILGSLATVVTGAEALALGAGGLYASATIAIIFSMMGMISPVVIDAKRWVGVLMIISGIIVLLAIPLLFGALPLILFISGGLVALKDRRSGGGKQSRRTPRNSGNDQSHAEFTSQELGTMTRPTTPNPNSGISKKRS